MLQPHGFLLPSIEGWGLIDFQQRSMIPTKKKRTRDRNVQVLDVYKMIYTICPIIHSAFDYLAKSIHREIYIDRENARERYEYIILQVAPERLLSFQSSETCGSMLSFVRARRRKGFEFGVGFRFRVLLPSQSGRSEPQGKNIAIKIRVHQ